MDGYLLDTCVISYWHDKRKEQHSRVAAHIEALPADAPLRMSAISLGEVEYGRQAGPPINIAVEVAFRKFMDTRLPNPLTVTQGTAYYYGRIRARLFNKYFDKRRRKGLRPEQMIDPVTGKDLGIQENDLWIAAQAAECGLVLVTGDAMDRIQSVIQDFFRIENWAKP